MAAKPTIVPLCGASGTQLIPDPTVSDPGYQPGERPPAEYANHLGNLTAEWWAYLLDGDMEGAHSFDSLVTFNAGSYAANINSYGYDTQASIVPAAGMKGGTADNEEYMTTTGTNIIVPITLPFNVTITSYEAFLRSSDSAAVNDFDLYSFDDSGTLTEQEATSTVVGDDVNTWTSKASDTIAVTLASEKHYFLVITTDAGNLDVSMVKINYEA